MHVKGYWWIGGNQPAEPLEISRGNIWGSGVEFPNFLPPPPSSLQDICLLIIVCNVWNICYVELSMLCGFAHIMSKSANPTAHSEFSGWRKTARYSHRQLRSEPICCIFKGWETVLGFTCLLQSTQNIYLLVWSAFSQSQVQRQEGEKWAIVHLILLLLRQRLTYSQQGGGKEGGYIYFSFIYYFVKLCSSY